MTFVANMHLFTCFFATARFDLEANGSFVKTTIVIIKEFAILAQEIQGNGAIFGIWCKLVFARKIIEMSDKNILSNFHLS